MVFGLIGWIMKQFKWPRPPLVLGVVLGDSIERYLFISIERYGIDWFARPVVAVLFLMAIYGLVRPLLQDVKSHGGVAKHADGFPGADIPAAAIVHDLRHRGARRTGDHGAGLGFRAKIVPLVVGGIALGMAALSLFNDMCRKATAPAAEGMAEQAQHEVGQKMHMDLTSDTGHLPVRTIILRAARFFAYLLVFMGVMAVIGLVPTVAVFVVVLHALRRQRTLVADYSLRGGADRRNCHRVRLVHGNPVAADAGGRRFGRR